VLDEPTSALDGVSEARIRRTLADLRGEMTIVIVAHRLSTLNFCTRLVAIVDGRVESEGDPTEVRSSSPFLARAVHDGGLSA
jgi:ABC-type bacteriocin/lantibiotic exporter with double-glycine peptidase domain